MNSGRGHVLGCAVACAFASCSRAQRLDSHLISRKPLWKLIQNRFQRWNHDVTRSFQGEREAVCEVGVTVRLIRGEREQPEPSANAAAEGPAAESLDSGVTALTGPQTGTQIAP